MGFNISLEKKELIHEVEIEGERLIDNWMAMVKFLLKAHKEIRCLKFFVKTYYRCC